MKKHINYIIIFISILLVACNNNDGNEETFTKVEGSESKSKTEVNTILDSPQDFIWKGLNRYYLWQENVPALSDTRFKPQEEYENFLKSDSDPLSFFYNLLYDYPNSDRFSFIHEDYVELDAQLAFNFEDSYAIEDTGIDFGLYLERNNTTNVYGYIRYVVPNSEADKTAIKRGDIFNRVNGVKLTTSNYRKLLFESSTITLGLASYNNGNPISGSSSITLDKAPLTENPILINKTFDIENKKVGYLMYNRFSGAYDRNLNDAFATLKSNNVTELVLDLRYNPGGSTNTALYLASMITGQFKGQLFSTEKWNAKAQSYYEENYPENLKNKFTDNIPNIGSISSLTLNRVIVLTSKSSASASELVINSLSPYIDVVVIGDVTVGKVVGSVTLYDSENFSKEGINTTHTYAMQPIVLEVKNKLGVNHPEGIAPNIIQRENLNNLGVLGNENEPLLKAALDYIKDGSISFTRNTEETREFTDKNENSFTGNNMYVDGL